jgi:hypothetical protein
MSMRPEGQGLYTHDDWIRSPYSWAQGQYTWRHYMRLGFDDGTAAGRDVVASENYVAQSGARDISLSPSNSNTSGYLQPGRKVQEQQR